MKAKKILVVIFVCVLLISTAACSGYDYKGGSKQELDNLNIHIDLKDDGSMDIMELWTINLEDRGKSYRNVYKSFKLDESKAGDITNFSVYDMDNDEEYTLRDVKNPADNINSGLSKVCYIYRDGSNVELGLYMPEIDEGMRNFLFKYTVSDAITVYNDTAVSYYQELGPSFSLPVNHMDCVIHLPNNEDKDSLRAWLHCTAESNLLIESAQRISFTADRIPNETMVETRICMPPELFANSTRRVNEDQFLSISQEEAKWQQDYEAKLRWQFILGIIDAAGGVILVALGILYYVKKRIQNKRFKLEMPEYVREIPENQTPGIMARIFYYYKNEASSKFERGKIFSATILNLACKKYLSIEHVEQNPRSKNKDVFQIRLHTKDGVGKLTEGETTFLNLLKSVSKPKNFVFTMSDFEQYAKRNYKYVDTMLEKFFADDNDECVERAYIGENENSSSMKVLGYVGLFVSILALALIGSMVYIPLGLLVASIIVLISTSKKPRLLIDGEKMFLTWKGLEKFMLEFSRMKEYSTLQLELWEEYLVYATAMGISEKVCKQLKLVYPQLNDPAYVDTNYNNTLLYWMVMDGRYYGSKSSNFNFGDVLASKMYTISSSATRLAHPPSSGGSSSGGGFGGSGFGGGGGGFGGGGGGVR